MKSRISGSPVFRAGLTPVADVQEAEIHFLSDSVSSLWEAEH